METGRMALNADGSCTVRVGNLTVLGTAVCRNNLCIFSVAFNYTWSGGNQPRFFFFRFAQGTDAFAFGAFYTKFAPDDISLRALTRFKSE
jgi:hypothetical protein